MDIYPVNNTNIVTVPDNFEFICNTTIDFHVHVILLIDGMSANNTKFDRIHTMNKTTAKETVFRYTFMNTISTDNGTTFSCIAINNKGTQFQSHLLTLKVHCEFVCVCVYFRECLSVCLTFFLPVCFCFCVCAYLRVFMCHCLSVGLPVCSPIVCLCVKFKSSVCVC